MAAFQQYSVPFLPDSVFPPTIKARILDEFMPNLTQFCSSDEISQDPLIICSNQEGSSLDNELSSVTEKQRAESLSMAEKADSGDQVSQSSFLDNNKKSYRKGSNSNSAKSKDVKQVKCKKQKEPKDVMKDKEEPPKGYIHVRARRGQATDSHSLAERVRREKISERMKKLQALVPGCDKVTGKALMLDEIINYVQSLQNQVEFLSMKLASLDPMVYTFGLMDHDPMMFGTQARNNGMALPTPLMQPTSNGVNCGIDQPQSFPTTNAMSCSTTSSATTPSLPSSVVDSPASLFQQEQKLSLLPLQDAGSLNWGVNEQQRQNIINHLGFSFNNLDSFH